MEGIDTKCPWLLQINKTSASTGIIAYDAVI